MGWAEIRSSANTSPLLGRPFFPFSLALSVVLVVPGFHQPHVVTSICTPRRDLVFWSLCGLGRCLVLGTHHPSWLFLHLLGPSCPISPGQGSSPAATSLSLQGTSLGNWHQLRVPFLLPATGSSTKHTLSMPSAPNKKWTRSPPQRVLITGLSICGSACWLLIFWLCYCLRVGLFISERGKKKKGNSENLCSQHELRSCLLFFPSL